MREQLGKGIRMARTQKGFKIRDVCGDAGISLSYWSDLENGRKQASFDVLDGICRVLDIRLSALFAFMLKEESCSPSTGLWSYCPWSW